MNLYIPASKSGAELAAKKAASIGTKIAKPLIVTLIIVSFPVAVALIKVFQSLDFLDLLNIKNTPVNIKYILDFVGEANLIGDMFRPIIGDFWNFEDPALGSSKSKKGKEKATINLLGRLRLLDKKKNLDSDVCTTHPILFEKEMSCYG